MLFPYKLILNFSTSRLFKRLSLWKKYLTFHRFLLPNTIYTFLLPNTRSIKKLIDTVARVFFLVEEQRTYAAINIVTLINEIGIGKGKLIPVIF